MRVSPRFLRTLAAGGGLLLVGCNDVRTIDDVVTESRAVLDDRFVGEWRENDGGGGSRARVVRGENRDYTVTYMDPEDTARMRARLGRLGSTLVVDVYPDTADWKTRKENGIPTHSVYAIDFYGDSIAIRGLDGDSVLKHLVGSQIRVPYSKVDGDLVLHGEAGGMRAAMAQLIQQRGVLRERTLYRRDRTRF